MPKGFKGSVVKNIYIVIQLIIFNFLKAFLVKVVQLIILSTVSKINKNCLYNAIQISKSYWPHTAFLSF